MDELLLIAEDDDEDYELTREALREAGFNGRLQRVRDGVELLNYLLRLGPFARAGAAPRPRVALIDLNMPRLDGRSALQQIKAHPALRRLPVLILTTGASEEDVRLAYDLGVNAFLRKPLQFDRLVEVLRGISSFWFDQSFTPAV